MENIIQYAKNILHKEIFITEVGCDLINQAQEMITRERIVIRDERKIVIPACQLWLIKDDKINALVTQIDEEYCIFVNSGLIEEQKTFLENQEWKWLSDETQKGVYIDDIIAYGFLFFVFHEYAHVLCGHNDAGLTDPTDKKAEEYEADLFSIDWLIKYIIGFKNPVDLEGELGKLFLAVYFLFEKMQKQNDSEYYNNKIIQNYYDNERAEKRTHPLDAQRVLYLFDMMDIAYIDDSNQLKYIKSAIFEQLKKVKGLTDVELPIQEDYCKIVKDSIQTLEDTVHDIRKKIPRMGDNTIQ